MIRLPEAKIEFSALVMFLHDRGATLCLEGFRTLHEHRQHTPELTTLMNFVPRGMGVMSSTASKSSYPLLTFARPGKAHGSISLLLNDITNPEHHLDLRRSKALKILETYPPSWVTVPLGTEQESDQFVIAIGRSGIRHVRLQSSSTSDSDNDMKPAHLKILQRQDDAVWGSWFTSAVIAVFGQQDQQHLDFRTDQKLVDLAQWYGTSMRRVNHLKLRYGYSNIPENVREWLKRCTHLLIHPRQPFELSRKAWYTSEKTYDDMKFWGTWNDLKTTKDTGSTLYKYLTMKTLLNVWLSFLISHSAALGSIKLPELPKIAPEPPNIAPLYQSNDENLAYFEGYLQRLAEVIIRAMLLDSTFAIKLVQDVQMAIVGDMSDVNTLMGENVVAKDATNYCCGIVLLAVIAQRADYLLPEEVVDYCEKEWKYVYLI